MNESALLGAVFGIAIATAAAGVAGYSMLDKGKGGAVAARETCYDVQVEHAVEPKDDRRIAGNQAQKRLQENHTITTTETRC